MTKSSSEHVADFLLEFLPGLLPKPADSATKAAVGTFREQLDNFLKQPRLRRELLEAAREAETDFKVKAREQLGNDELTQAVASFPLFDRELFQCTLLSLPEHMNEGYLASHLKTYIADDWKGKFTPAELREGVAIYLNCLRLRLLKIEGYADIVSRLATLRTDQRTEQILVIVNELLQLVKTLLERTTIQANVATTPFTIPLPVQDFTGRDEELEQLKSEFKRGVVITGISGGGGIGKTELARKLAQDIKDDYPDARLSIDLLGTSETALAPEEAMRRLLEPFYPNAKLPDEPEQLKGLYQQTFASRKALLLLDNASNAKQVRPLIPPAPSAAIVTSRQHFSLTESGLKEPLRLDVLSPEKSRELLRTASDKLKDSPDLEVDQLAKLCGRLPLALRVAASLLNDRSDWSLVTLLKRLEDERTRLERLRRDDDQDLDVEATLSLSYQLLTDDLKKYFRMLGLFIAPFLDISVKAVCGMGDEDDVEGMLGKLVSRSLLNVQSDERITRSLYALHDLTRLFATNCLLENEEEAKEAIARHAEHFLQWASEADDLYLKGNENILLGLAHFRFIWPHLLSAYERFLPEQKAFPRSEIADRWLSNFPGRCAYVLDLHLPPRQKIPVLENALEAAKRLGDKSNEGIDLGNLGLAYAELGDARKAIEFHEQALVIEREIGDRRGEGNTLGNLGLAYAELGDARKAIEFYEGQLVIVREIGDRRGEGNALGNLGITYAGLREIRKAIEFHEKQLAIFREIGYRHGEGNALGSLGNAYLRLGDAHKAIEFYGQILVIHHEIGDRRGEELDLGNLGNAYFHLGDVHKAIEFYEQAMVIAREIGDRRNQGNWLANMGTVHKKLGEKEKARNRWQEALAIFQAIEDPNAARVQKWLSELDEVAEEQSSKGMTVGDFVLGALNAVRTKNPQAEQYFQAASKLARDSNAPAELQELGKVLQKILTGDKHPDLSHLPEEFAKLIKEALGK